MSSGEEIPLEQLATEISKEVGIRFEYETVYLWMCSDPEASSVGRCIIEILREDPQLGLVRVRGVDVCERSTPFTFRSTVSSWRSLTSIGSRHRFTLDSVSTCRVLYRMTWARGAPFRIRASERMY